MNAFAYVSNPTEGTQYITPAAQWLLRSPQTAATAAGNLIATALTWEYGMLIRRYNSNVQFKDTDSFVEICSGPI